MPLASQNVLILLGGIYHDFAGFSAWAERVLSAAGCRVEATYDLERLRQLDPSTTLVISYTSLSLRPTGQAGDSPELLSVEQLGGLRGWVRQGGGLLSVHCGTVAGKSGAEYGELFGGVFVEHPPQFSFSVYPLNRAHPITAGIEAFSVHDEFYMQRLVGAVEIHMVAIDRGVAHPMVWSRGEGAGRVAHIAMGHSAQVWDLPAYRQLFLQASAWVTGA
jgi:uncharacterized protein